MRRRRWDGGTPKMIVMPVWGSGRVSITAVPTEEQMARPDFRDRFMNVLLDASKCLHDAMDRLERDTTPRG